MRNNGEPQSPIQTPFPSVSLVQRYKSVNFIYVWTWTSLFLQSMVAFLKSVYFHVYFLQLVIPWSRAIIVQFSWSPSWNPYGRRHSKLFLPTFSILLQLLRPTWREVAPWSVMCGVIWLSFVPMVNKKLNTMRSWQSTRFTIVFMLVDHWSQQFLHNFTCRL